MSVPIQYKSWNSKLGEHYHECAVCGIEETESLMRRTLHCGFVCEKKSCTPKCNRCHAKENEFVLSCVKCGDFTCDSCATFAKAPGDDDGPVDPYCHNCEVAK